MGDLDNRSSDGKFAQGAKVRRPYYVDATALAIVEHTVPSASLRTDAYQLAMASKHKPWARRWLRERRYL